ncbi:glycosyltransferase family protein [Aquipuribacter sp. SD81]|uniref:glycosyltransferase family protein n=1 Tax=Aquipuribacter sp. SD81 TaxID=3127703 RepID=UPI00301703F1
MSSGASRDSRPRRSVGRALRRRALEVRRLLWHVRRDPSRLRSLPAGVVRAVRPSATPRPVVAAGRDAPSVARGPSLPELPEAPERSARPRDVRVATLLDEFSQTAFAPEWHGVPVTPQSWQQVLDEGVDLLFAESAWRGNGGAWNYAMTGTNAPSAPLREMVAAFRAKGVPTVFWNKEDPPNYERFVDTARLFDHVLTVDEDCVPRYREDLGHDRVSVMQFAAQLAVHNPANGGARHRYDVAFAGTWFAEKHEDRRRQLEMLLGAAKAARADLDIYSRMQGEDQRYWFPPRWQKHVRGSLPYRSMLSAYRAYKVFLNVNSVTGSRTMCARRVFELTSCGTAVLSTPSAGIEATFGDLIATADDADSARDLLRLLLASPEYRERAVHKAMRFVHRHHTYSHRAEQVLDLVGVPTTPAPEGVTVVIPTMRPQNLEQILRLMGAQTYRPLEVVVVAHGFEVDDERLEQLRELSGLDVRVVPVSADRTLGHCMSVGLSAVRMPFFAKVDDDNYYGPEYLADLMTAFEYTDAAVVGKLAHYVHLRSDQANMLRFAAREHRFVDLVQGGTIVGRTDVSREVGFSDIPRAVDTDFLTRLRDAGHLVYSADRYNFLSYRSSDASEHTWTIGDRQILARSSQVLFYGDGELHVTV